MKIFARTLLIILSLCFLSQAAFAAAPASITYAYNHFLFTVSVLAHPEWKAESDAWYFYGQPALAPANLTALASDQLPPHWERRKGTGWNEAAIAATLEKEIGAQLNREAGTVEIGMTDTGAITFNGQGLTGRKVDIGRAVTLTIAALVEGASSVVLPVRITQPQVTVASDKLKGMGIREVVTIGESSFARSPVNRRHNIGVGIARFNGHLIPQGTTFSFDDVLGPVNAATGYRKELVIQGDQTIPDYGGGLCQVSSTAYRGPWEYGLPILQRKNHSYVVSYYSPQGTDATIYPPRVDLKFLNDTPGALLMQTFTDDRDRAYFVYYGTKDDRTSEVFGPFTWDFTPASADVRILYAYSPDLAVGEKRKVSERHDGVKVLWYRTVAMPAQAAKTERVYSYYDARSVAYQIGVAKDDIRAATGGTLSSAPSWLPSAH